MDELQQKFFSDPSWAKVEDIILNYINPLIDMTTIDLTQPAEHVKAEIIGRIYAYNSMAKFLGETKLVGRSIQQIKNPFK